MFEGLNNLLRFGEEKLPEKQTLFLTESDTDGTFVLHHLISLFLKGGHSVCLVSFAQSFNHYSNVATKLGVNLNAAKLNGDFVFVDGLSQVGERLLELQTKSNPSEWDGIFSRTEDSASRLLYKLVEDGYKSLKNWQKTPSLVIVDDLTVLINLGIPIVQVTWFVHYLQVLISETAGCLALLLHNDKAAEDDELNCLDRTLEHRSDVAIEVTGLHSGYSTVVHGQLLVKWRCVDSVEPRLLRSSTAQFLVEDRNVKIFAHGTASAVLGM